MKYPGFMAVYKIIGLQALAIITLAMLIWLLGHHFQAAYSFLWGGMICVLGNWYLARKLFAFQGALAARRIVRAFYWGEAVKLLLTGFLFWIGFKFGSVIPFVLLIGYIVAQFMFWLTVGIQNTLFRSLNYYEPSTRTDSR